MMLRMLGYLVRIWERVARDAEAGEGLPPIAPVVLHNGPRGWKATTSFEDLVALPERARAALLPLTPRFSAHLVELRADHASTIQDEWLTAFGRLVLWALSIAGDNPRFLAEIDRMQGAIAEALAASDGYQALAALLRYISSTHERLGAARFEKALTSAARKDEAKIMMTILEELEQRGEQRGRTAGRATTLLDQLAARFGEVPAAARTRILAADEQTLARWSLRVLTESSIEAVLSGRPAAPRKRAAARRR